MAARGETLRADDNPDALRRRLALFHTQTAPVIKYYAGTGLLASVDGMRSVEEVAAAIEALLAPRSESGRLAGVGKTRR
jgi:adenylate kinase